MNVLPLSITININWEILLANGPYILLMSFLGLIGYTVLFGLTYAVLDLFDFYYSCNESNMRQFLKTNAVLISIALIVWGLVSWVAWSNKTLNKQENINKPIVECIQDK